jgi:hypothetical protein
MNEEFQEVGEYQQGKLKLKNIYANHGNSLRYLCEISIPMK